MHDRNLASVEGVTRSQRTIAFLALLVASLFAVMVAQTQDRAYALAIPAVPTALVPATLTTEVAAGWGTVSAYAAAEAGSAAVITTSGGVATAAAAGGAVALAPVAVAAGAALLTGAAIYVGWKWASGHTSTQFDAPASGNNYVTQNCINGYTCTATTSGVSITRPMNGAGSLNVGAVTSNGLCGSAQSIPQGGTWTCTAPAGQFWTWAGVYADAARFGTGNAGQNNGYVCMARFATVPPGQGGCSASGLTTGTPGAVGSGTATTTPKSQCSDGSIVSGAPVTYGPGLIDSATPPMLLPACPAGTTRTGAQFPTTQTGGTAGQPLGNWTPKVVPAAFAECNVVGVSCQLTLLRRGFASGTQDTACNSTGNCADWQRQTQRAAPKTTVKTLTAVGTAVAGDDVQEVPRRYPNGDPLDCMWGPYHVPVDECITVPTDPPTDPPVPPNDPNNRRCWPTGFAMLNPLEWVVKPLKCLFIPDEAAVQAAGSSISTAWNGTAPATISSKVGQVVAPIVALKDDTGATDCNGPVFTIPKLPAMDKAVTLHPLSTCNALTTYLLGIYLPLATALIYIGGFFAGTRVILKSFNLDTPEEV